MGLQKIILSRTDSIGDVVLTLPMAGIIKSYLPESKIIFIGRQYTEDIITASQYIDRFVAWDDVRSLEASQQLDYIREIKADTIIHVFPKKEIAVLARKAQIPLRIGTSHRVFHWINCNKKIHFTRKRSPLHEAQLNLKLLSGIGIDCTYSLAELSGFFGLTKTIQLDFKYSSLLSDNAFNLIIHPMSKGSAREWGLKNYKELIEMLPRDKFRIFITGTWEEGNLISNVIDMKQDHIVNLCGKLTLAELISFIANCDGLLACSTGPLHIAAALNKYALGIYAPIKPMHPGRWAPIGKNASYIVKKESCSKCRRSNECKCILSITPLEIKEKLIDFYSMKYRL